MPGERASLLVLLFSAPRFFFSFFFFFFQFFFLFFFFSLRVSDASVTLSPRERRLIRDGPISPWRCSFCYISLFLRRLAPNSAIAERPSSKRKTHAIPCRRKNWRNVRRRLKSSRADIIALKERDPEKERTERESENEREEGRRERERQKGVKQGHRFAGRERSTLHSRSIPILYNTARPEIQ